MSIKRLTLNLLGATLVLASHLSAGTITIAPGPSPAGGYLALSLFGITPIVGVGDDTEHGFTVPSFRWGGADFTHINVSSNGFLTVGTSSATSFVNQSMPDGNQPNGVLAPFWTDLTPGASGAIRIGTLTDGTNTWIVVDWNNMQNFSDPTLNTFEAWLRVGGVEDISFAYGSVGSGNGGLLTVGAENLLGDTGANYYFNGAGLLPVNGTTLVVSSAGLPNAPEPGTWLSLGTGLSALGLLKFRAKRKAQSR